MSLSLLRPPRATRARDVAITLVLAAALASACSREEAVSGYDSTAVAPSTEGPLFTRMPSAYTGVRFVNTLRDSPDTNVFTYRNFYNGGGVAIGDLTGDGLPEVVLSANQGGVRLYLNEGKFRFRDVSEQAGVRGKAVWTTGLTLADVDGDGRLDLYVSRAGQTEPPQRANALFINQGLGADGVPRFLDRAQAMGLADEAYTTHTAFFDYDRDGDLDAFLINNSPRPVSSFGQRNTRNVRHPHGGHKLYRNDGGRYTDVSAQAGIYGSEIGFGLGVGVSDVNRDGWPDVYVANDFFERDYLYLNQKNGTFAEALDRQMAVSSYFSMGMDIADVDNDGWTDVYTTDMLPEDEYRLRTMSSFEGWDVYQTKVQNGYHHQLMRNMLQRNNGNGTFSDVGQLAGVARTDWSWSALVTDLDLDGRKDIVVTNGLVRDVTSQDYIAFLANEETMEDATKTGTMDFMKLINAMASTPIPNYAFRNTGALSFTNVAAAWGLDTPSFSSGAAYGDLDGDGALDLVVNNVNQEAFVYRNNALRQDATRRYLHVKLVGEGGNRFAVGARVAVTAGGETQIQELYPARGFQSSVDYTLAFGIAGGDSLARVQVTWPDGRESVVAATPLNRTITIAQSGAGAQAGQLPSAAAPPRLIDITLEDRIAFAHKESEFVDFDRERLLPHMLSIDGPGAAVGDVNADGLDDLFIGGAKDQAGQLLVQRANGRFVASNTAVFEADAVSEDVGAVFFDADGDRDLDLYVVSGGNEYSDLAPALQDRLYVNDGNGSFTRHASALPVEMVAGARPTAGDYDGDGDVDLYVGGRSVPWRYGEDPRSTLLRNDGRGRFTDVTTELAPELERVGLVTDALWTDTDRDGRLDLVVVGEWMPITVFRNMGQGKLQRVAAKGLEQTHGWWNRIVASDVDGDGRLDFVVGNLGTNTRLRATPQEPATMVARDFLGSGFMQQVVATYAQGQSYPIVLRDDLIRSLPPLKARYLNYSDYAKATMPQIFTAAELSGAIQKKAERFESVVVFSEGNGAFVVRPLPTEAQLAPIFGVLPRDVDGDGALDLLLAGNFDGFKPEIGRASESYGTWLRVSGKREFTPLRTAETGFMAQGQVRDLLRVRTRTGDVIVAVRNNDRPQLFARRRGGAR